MRPHPNSARRTSVMAHHDLTECAGATEVVRHDVTLLFKNLPHYAQFDHVGESLIPTQEYQFVSQLCEIGHKCLIMLKARSRYQSSDYYAHW